jgi:DNA-binding response OmpR family regulator
LVIAWQQAEQTVLSLLEEGVDQYMTFPICVNRLRSKILSLLNNTPQ